MARVWDLRSGRDLLTLAGHVKPVVCVDFSPDGYHMVTGSDDHTVRVWDLRKKKSIYTLPAHSKLISALRYQVRATSEQQWRKSWLVVVSRVTH
jgi:U4/U6 small nuclear ribonucleoprotein PRP4